MGNLFNRLESEGLYHEWAVLLDWLFDDDRFRDWPSGYVGALTKKIKRLPFVGDETYFWENAKNICFPTHKAEKKLLIMMVKGDSEVKDLVRHIRNGIAHGKTTLFKQNGVLFIEIVDFSKGGSQSAYLCLPIDYVNKIYKLYQDVKNSWKNKKRGN